MQKVEAGIDRYLRAFESGAMPESLCGPRLKALGGQAGTLRTRRQELTETDDTEAVSVPSEADLVALRELVADTVTTGSPAQVKVVLQGLVEEGRVDGRHAIKPIFRVPTLGGRSGK